MKKGRRQNFIMSPACLWFVLAVLAYNVCDVKAKAYMATLEIKDEQRPDRSRRSADMIDPSSYRLDVKEAMVHFLRRDKDMHLDDDDNGHGQGQRNGNGDDDDAVDDAAQARIDREAAEMLASMVNDINARLFTLAENIKELMRSQYLLNSRLAAVETAIGVGNVLGSLFPVRPEPTPKAPSTTTSLPTPQPTSTSAESGSQVDMAKQLLDNAADDIDEAIDLLQEGGQSSKTSMPPHGVASHATAMLPHPTPKQQTAVAPHSTSKQQTAMVPHPTPKQQTAMPPLGDMQQQSMLPHGNPQHMEMSTRVNALLTATTSQGNMKPHTTMSSHGSTSSSPQSDSGTGHNHNHQSNGSNHGNHEDEGVNNHGNQGNHNDDQQTVSEEPTAIDATENDNDNGGGTVIEEKELPHGFRPYSFRRYNPFTDARRGDLLNRIRVSLAHRAVPVDSQPRLPRPRLPLAEDSYRRKNTP